MATMLATTACGGGGGDTSPAPGNTAGTPVSAKTTPGVWQGTVTSPTTGQSSVVGLTSGSGHSVWMTTDGRVWTGQMPMSGTQFNATMAGYMYPGSRFPDGSTYGTWSMMGNYANGIWSGQFNGAGDNTTFSFSMHPAYNRPASLDLLAGTYTRTTSIGYTMTLSFTQAGQLTGSDSRGCVFNGNVTVPDQTHNLYQIAATVTSCGILDGSYQGQGTLADATAMQSWMSNMGCFQYGAGGWSGGMMGGGMMGGGMGGWWPNQGSNTVPSGTGNLFMFAMTSGQHAIMDALAR
ncbi:MAG: hypothetical protein IT483_06925 [Gammaproteobacteria bacterium]|nr:hypothetical protein [Gammaproteobacteria bacterium]